MRGYKLYVNTHMHGAYARDVDVDTGATDRTPHADMCVTLSACYLIKSDDTVIFIGLVKSFDAAYTASIWCHVRYSAGRWI